MEHICLNNHVEIPQPDGGISYKSHGLGAVCRGNGRNIPERNPD